MAPKGRKTHLPRKAPVFCMNTTYPTIKSPFKPLQSTVGLSLASAVVSLMEDVFNDPYRWVPTTSPIGKGGPRLEYTHEPTMDVIPYTNLIRDPRMPLVVDIQELLGASVEVFNGSYMAVAVCQLTSVTFTTEFVEVVWSTLQVNFLPRQGLPCGGLGAYDTPIRGLVMSKVES